MVSWDLMINSNTKMMKSLSLLAFVACLLVSVAGTQRPLLTDEEIDYINSLPGNTWKAGRNPGFDTAEEVGSRLGLDVKANILYNKLHLSYPELVYPDVSLPRNFDAREKWANCSTMKIIRDQSNCGSCWAFGSAEAMSDRVCVFNKTNVFLSADDILTCCTTCGEGCRGGYISAAYQYWIDKGVVSGGLYGSKTGCLPYVLHPCPKPTPACKKLHPTPQCHRQCIPESGKTYQKDKHFGKRSYGVNGVEQIMKEIYTNGPVTAGFTVYADFMAYKSGVYKHVTGQMLGGHAVKILGWGVEGGQDYWLVANSWNVLWGLKGYFKIARGTDECGIENQIVAGIPRN